MTITINVNFELSEKVGFNDKNHLVNFLNYLFRTDKKQKWTNELTDKNVFLMKTKNELDVIPFPSSIEERLQLRDMMYELLSEFLDCNHLEFLKNDIIYLDIHDKETGDNSEHLLNSRQVEQLLSQLIETEKNGKENLFSVAHLDQKDSVLHLHTVLMSEV
ncbi:hypothetical protein COL32_12090 [Bacillus pseudomycoides]|uniref:Uncharacterized protein n=1 Tax=Bacillus pseudomycoides TaxID=64104 RepID=A0ABD6T9G6_9BACI|nr:hypothetical protein [Bacillus pseudomycoides]PFX44587.1 hypothetical protein COL32_12090 [Bacillus pseudomycoides]PHE99963.1 hypothetical protein COF81_09605 [Bacillus pseudomycoides]